ncbi:MAG: 2-oxo-4-hydroxy-4-carboxy-5-ureidoimidazoline decarboxylase [Cyclobacteriaceae bacterium]|nr:2-oxo-4-hydroxy-4-carboxy-5-ureidoimidazoline decarboxylase [Cyclobacteriaceae bacterium]
MTLEELNNLPFEQQTAEFTKCCGAHNWVNKMVASNPYTSANALLETADSEWLKCTEEDGLEAFTHHPKIGDVKSLAAKYGNTKDWASNEQKEVESASKEAIKKLAHLNKVYEDRFGFIFIVCATGKSAEEMLEILESRLDNDYNDEVKIAMGEQHKITVLRLKKLLS